MSKLYSRLVCVILHHLYLYSTRVFAWFLCSCVGVEEEKATEIDLYHCPNCQVTHGPSVSKFLLFSLISSLISENNKLLAEWPQNVPLFSSMSPKSTWLSNRYCVLPFLFMSSWFYFFPSSLFLQCVNDVEATSRQMEALVEEEIQVVPLKRGVHSLFESFEAALSRGKIRLR